MGVDDRERRWLRGQTVQDGGQDQMLVNIGEIAGVIAVLIAQHDTRNPLTVITLVKHGC